MMDVDHGGDLPRAGENDSVGRVPWRARGSNDRKGWCTVGAQLVHTRAGTFGKKVRRGEGDAES
jgi:hypothetical protein